MVEFVKGTPADYEEIVDFASFIFSQSSAPHDFEALLPKLYKKGTDNEKYHYLVKDNGRIRAVVCSSPVTFHVAGHALHGAGIGSVCVHKAERGKGYMQKLMEWAVDDLRKEGVDFAMLGGQRQRYEFFGFESGGIQMNATVSAGNVRHALAKEDASGIEIREIQPQDEDLIARAMELHQKEAICAERELSRFYDTCRNWDSKIYAVFEGDRMTGYFILRKDSMTEFVLEDYSRMGAVVRTVFETCGGFSFMDSVTEPARMRFYEDVCEGYSLSHNKRFLFFQYENTIRAFLELKARQQKLPDGELFLEIKGYGKLRVALHDGKAECEKTDRPCSVVLAGNKAVPYLFAPIRPFYGFGTEPSPLADAWFPLPLYIPRQDAI